jgi:hypothetical protein
VIPDKYMIAFDTLAHAQEGQAAFPAYVFATLLACSSPMMLCDEL